MVAVSVVVWPAVRACCMAGGTGAHAMWWRAGYRACCAVAQAATRLGVVVCSLHHAPGRQRAAVLRSMEGRGAKVPTTAYRYGAEAFAVLSKNNIHIN